MNLHILKSQEEFSRTVADWIMEDINLTLQDQDRYTLVLSGGNTPKALYHLLSAEPYRSRIDWSKLHFFWGDERGVPFSDERNNARMAYENLLDLVPVPPSHIHKMETENIGPKASAEGYELILKRYFPATAGHKLENSFDLVLLGMGEDGHVLSLFPGTPGVHELERWVISLWLESQDMSRITLTQSIVNLSKKIAFLTTGSNKAHALREVLKGEYNPNQYPSQVINPVKGELHWFVDEAAASMLKIY